MGDAIASRYGRSFRTPRTDDGGPADTRAASSVQTEAPGRAGDPLLAWVVVVGIAAALGLVGVSVRVG